jgi:hypothetical protein
VGEAVLYVVGLDVEPIFRWLADWLVVVFRSCIYILRIVNFSATACFAWFVDGWWWLVVVVHIIAFCAGKEARRLSGE